MRQREYELLRMNDGGEVRVWLDGQIDILKMSQMTAGFAAAKKRQTIPTEVERTPVAWMLPEGPDNQTGKPQVFMSEKVVAAMKEGGYDNLIPLYRLPSPLERRTDSREVFQRFQKWTILLDAKGAQEFWDDINWLQSQPQSNASQEK